MKKKQLYIAIGTIAVLGGIAYFGGYNKIKEYQFKRKCIKSGGVMDYSGNSYSCDYLNCDKEKHSCNFYK